MVGLICSDLVMYLRYFGRPNRIWYYDNGCVLFVKGGDISHYYRVCNGFQYA